LVASSNFSGGFEVPFFDDKQVMPDHYVALGFDESRSNIVEIDALQGLCNMERSRLACVIDAAPIENTIRGVAVLLDLNQDITGANGVKSA
jgi:hypothetical protein